MMHHSLQMLLVHLGSGGLEVVLTWHLRISLKRMSSTSILYVNTFFSTCSEHKYRSSYVYALIWPKSACARLLCWHLLSCCMFGA
jgi:hypothetical protein